MTQQVDPMMHAPAPWRVTRKSIADANGMALASVADGYFAAERPCVVPLPSAYTDATVAANARLIAAAPELLAALKWALQYGEFDSAVDNPLHGRALDEARAAIAKASGVSATPQEGQ